MRGHVPGAARRPYPGRAAQARALGIWAAVSSLVLPAGPLLGGFLVTGGGWRLVFLINIPLVAAALISVLLLVAPGAVRPRSARPDPDRSRAGHNRLRGHRHRPPRPATRLDDRDRDRRRRRDRARGVAATRRRRCCRPTWCTGRPSPGTTWRRC
ncbi:MAG TPA: MFS transporter [Pseudonocardiaceae bacterium]